MSFKTVSRVLNNENSVKANTRERVLRVVDDLGYTPNHAARNLAANCNYSIGYVYNNPNAHYVVQFQEGLLDRCHHFGYELLILPARDSGTDFVKIVKELIKGSKMAGLVLTPPFSEDTKVISFLEENGTPFVRVVSADKSESLGVNCICIDDYNASMEMAQYLRGINHRNMAVFSGDPKHKSTRQRVDGFVAGTVDDSLDESCVIKVYEGEFSFESGARNMQKCINSGDLPTAIFALNDEIAAGALFGARLAGINVPEDLTIVGFENSPFSTQTIPQLTTANQPIREIASIAGERLVSIIRSRENVTAPIVFRPEIVIRDSASPPRSSK